MGRCLGREHELFDPHCGRVKGDQRDRFNYADCVLLLVLPIMWPFMGRFRLFTASLAVCAVGKSHLSLPGPDP